LPHFTILSPKIISIKGNSGPDHIANYFLLGKKVTPKIISFDFASSASLNSSLF